MGVTIPNQVTKKHIIAAYAPQLVRLMGTNTQLIDNWAQGANPSFQALILGADRLGVLIDTFWHYLRPFRTGLQYYSIP
jgi:hypothetical protein